MSLLLAPLNPPITDWRGKTAWIVGASSGIGRAVAVALLSRGARVAVSARSGDALESMAARHPGAAIVLPLDVRDAAEGLILAMERGRPGHRRTLVGSTRRRELS